MTDSPAVPSPRYQCDMCELSMGAPRCVCGGRGLRLVDRRPVLLSDELRRLVDGALDEAIREARTTDDPVRARLLRSHVILHFMGVLRDHEVATGRRRRGLTGFRTLDGTTPKQLAMVSRMSMGGLRPSERRSDG